MVRGMAVAGLVLGLLAACGDDASSESADATAPDPGSTEPEGGTDASTTTEGTLPPAFQDGTYFGKIEGIDLDGAGGPYADFDVARLHEGTAAEQAMADGVPGCEEAIDYCIEDEDDTNELVPIADDVEVLEVDVDDCCDATPSDLETFAAGDTEAGRWVEITVADGEITKIEEIYFP
jgi:hypothetical protein